MGSKQLQTAPPTTTMLLQSLHPLNCLAVNIWNLSMNSALVGTAYTGACSCLGLNGLLFEINKNGIFFSSSEIGCSRNDSCVSNTLMSPGSRYSLVCGAE